MPNHSPSALNTSGNGSNDSGSDVEEHDEDHFQEAASDLDRNGHETDEYDEDSQDDYFEASELADLIAQATTHKAAGNAHFSELRTNDALDQYREGINCLPVRKPPKIKNASKDSRGKGKDRLDLQEGLDFEAHDTDEKRESGMKSKDRIRELQDDQDEQQFFEEGKKSIEEQEVEQLRSILWSNVAACQLRLFLYKEAANSASEALLDNPNYVKALQRRASANEKLQTWTSLTSALEDFNTLSRIPLTPKSFMSTIRLAQRRLPAQIEEKKATETKEMMDKLKGLGNTFLGKFGMSTDNFQFVKNEETGGYSMNFSQNPAKT